MEVRKRQRTDEGPNSQANSVQFTPALPFNDDTPSMMNVLDFFNGSPDSPLDDGDMQTVLNYLQNNPQPFVPIAPSPAQNMEVSPTSNASEASSVVPQTLEPAETTQLPVGPPRQRKPRTAGLTKKRKSGDDKKTRKPSQSKKKKKPNPQQSLREIRATVRARDNKIKEKNMRIEQLEKKQQETEAELLMLRSHFGEQATIEDLRAVISGYKEAEFQKLLGMLQYQNQVLENMEKNFRTELTDKDKELENLTAKLNASDKQLNDNKLELESEQSRNKMLDDVLGQHAKNLAAQERELASLKEQLNNKDHELALKNQEMERQAASLSELQSCKERLEQAQELHSNNQEIEKYRQEMRVIDELLPKLIKPLDESGQRISSLMEELNKKDRILAAQHKQIEETRKYINRLRIKIRKELEENNRQISSLKADSKAKGSVLIDQRKKIAEIEQQLKSCKEIFAKEFADKAEAIRSLQTELQADKSKDVENRMLNQKIQELTAQLKELESLRGDVNEVRDWLVRAPKPTLFYTPRPVSQPTQKAIPQSRHIIIDLEQSTPLYEPNTLK